MKDLEPILGRSWDIITFTINFMTRERSRKDIIEYIEKIDKLSYNQLLIESLKILESWWTVFGMKSTHLKQSMM